MAPNQFPMGNPMGGASPGMNTSTIDQLLAPYGISLPNQLAQPGFEGTGWGQNHPGLSRGIDNALIAVGNMGPTGATAGENISNAARGIMSVGPYRRAYANQQMMLPLEMAKAVGGLRTEQATEEELRARGQYYRDVGAGRLGANQTRLQVAELNAAQKGAGQLRIGSNGKVQEPYTDPATFEQMWRDTDIDPEEFKKEQVKGHAANRFGGGATGSLIANNLAAHYGGFDKIPDVVDPAVYNRVFSQANSMTPGVIGTNIRENTVPKTANLSDATKASESQYKGFKYDSKYLDPAAEMKRTGNQMLMAGVPYDKAQAAMQGTVQMRQQFNQALDSAWSEYNKMPPEARMTMDFGAYAQTRGIDTQRRVLQQGGQGPSQAPAQSPMPGAPNPSDPMNLFGPNAPR